MAEEPATAAADIPTEPVLPPAGWYPDKSGRQRWWDGNKWTGAVVDDAPTPPKNESGNLQFWGWVCAILLPFFGFIIGIILLAKGKIQGLAIMIAAFFFGFVWFLVLIALGTSSA